MADPNPLNQQSSPFNAQGELFNSNVLVSRPSHFVTPIAAASLPGTLLPPVRPRVLTNLGGDVAPVVVDTPAVTTKQMTGSYAATRAARVAHMHEAGVFDLIRTHLTQTTKPDPTDAQLDQQYADLRAFSYMPTQMLPTREEFGQMSRPSQVAGYISSVMSKIAGVGRPTTLTPPAEQGSVTVPLLPANTPYSQSLNAFCAERFFTGTLNVEV